MYPLRGTLPHAKSLHPQYNRHKSRKQPTEEELAAIKEEDYTLQAELEMVARERLEALA